MSKFFLRKQNKKWLPRFTEDFFWGALLAAMVAASAPVYRYFFGN